MRKTTVWICSLIVCALPLSAGAETKPVVPVSPTIAKPGPVPVAVAMVPVKVTDGKYTCGNPSSSNVTATFTNTSTTADLTYGVVFETVESGPCTKMDPKKNPDGSACAPSGFCAGYCETWGPDKITNSPSKELKLAKGASAPLSVTVPNAGYKKISAKVTQGTASATFTVVGTPTKPCIF